MNGTGKWVLASVLGLVGASISPAALHAQFIDGTAQLSGQSAGSGSYDYTLTLNNTSNSTSQIETFWYSWEPGYDFLPSNPANIQTPAGWSGSINHTSSGFFGPDGYSIEFTTSSNPLNPGSSLTFTFSSPDSPSALSGGSPYFPYPPVGTSYLYQDGPLSGASEQIDVATVVPEPSPVSLVAAGLLGLLVMGGGPRLATRRLPR